MDSATIVAAALDSSQLEQSINKLVQTVASKTKEMADNFTSEIGRMEQAVKNLGNINIGSGGASDGGSSRRTSTLKKEEEQVRSVVSGYDAIAAANSRAAQSASVFIQNEREQLRMRQHEIEARLKEIQSKYGNVEIRTIVRDDGTFSRAIDNIKQKIQEARQKLQEVPPTSALGRQFSQELQTARVEYNELLKSRKAFESQSQVTSLTSEYQQNNQKIKELASAYAHATTEQKQLESSVNSGAAAIEKYGNSADKAYQKMMKLSFDRAINIPTKDTDLAAAKLERLQAILADYRFLGALSPSQIARARKEVDNLEQALNTITTKQEHTTQSAHQYTEEIRRQAQAIRESVQWKEKGYAMIGDRVYYDPERSVAPAKNRLSLEEQILNVQKEEEVAAIRAASAQRQEAAEKAATEQEARKVLATEQQITAEQQKRSQPKTFASYDSLQESIAHVLGLQKQQVRLVDEETASYRNLDSALKQYRQAYNTLTDSERKSDNGKMLVRRMQEISREIQKIQALSARPISLESIIGKSVGGARMDGLPEKTLDDIAYKMQRLASLRSGLNVETQQKEIRTVNQEYDRLKKKMDEVMQKNQSMIASNNALGRSWNYMKNRLAFYVTVGAGTQFIKSLIEVRSQYEMNEKALGILLDSASRGTRIFNELSQMSLVSPYTLIELSAAAKQLTAYDIAAKDVVDTTRRLADMASAVGVPVERLTYALGQIKAYGYLNSRDARMFANAGIPLVKQLADYYSELEGKIVSTADVYDRMKKKAIDYNDVMKVVTKMTDEGGKFFDFQAKMADTLKVRLANLTLAWNNMLNELGKSNQGGLTTGIKSLTVVFRHWREIYRVVSTLIVALGAYKVATMLAGITTKSSIGSSAVASWFSLARGVKSAKDAVALFSLTLKSIPFTAWFTTIATLASYFYLFNNSTDGLKQKLEDIATAFDGVRKEITDLYADALKSDSIGSQLTKLRDMLELAQTELGVTIPIKLEEVNEGNVKQKLKEVKNIIDNYLNFSQEFSEAAAGTKFNELMNEFGTKARSTYTGISESINTVVVALQDLVDKGNASKRDLKILNELTSGQKEDESRIEYLQRLVRLYEELGLVGKKVTTPSLSFSSSSTDNMNELTEKQNEQLDRLGIKNKQVFENMLKDVQGYYSSSSIAQYQFEQQVERVAKRIDINNIPVEQRTLKLSAAINEEASLNNWNQFEKEFARQVANQKFGTTIEISDESKGVAEQDLKDWQKKQQEWAVKNGITIPINFQTNDTEISYAKRMLQAAKDAKEEVDVQQRKLAVGTGSQDAVDAAKKAYENARTLAKNAGADLEQLDKKANAATKKAAKAAESELAKALKDELSTIEKVRSIYKDLTKEGMSHADAVAKATKGWDETVNAINKVLQKNGLKKLNLADFVGVDNPREMMKTLQAQLESMVKRGASASEIKVIQEKIRTLEVDADKYDLTKITKGLNSELDRLKDEYELAVALDADPELGGIFADMFDLNVDQLPHSINEYAERVTAELNKALKKRGDNIQLPTIYLTKDDIDAFREMSDGGKLNKKSFEEIQKAYQDFVSLRKKAATDVSKIASDYIREYGDLSAQIQQIEIEKNDALMKLNEIYNTDALRQTQRYLDAKFAIEDGAKRKQAKATFDALKKEADYERFFTAIDTLTKKDALSIKNKIKNSIIDAFKNGGLTISQFRKEIKALEEQFDKLSQPTSNWISYLNGGFDKLIQKAKETGQEIETIGEKISITGKVDEKDKNYLQSLGNIFSNGKGGNTDFSSLMSHFGKDMKGLGSNISKAGQGMQAGASGFAGAVTIVDAIIKNVHQTVQAIGSVIDELDSVRNEDNKISNAYWEGFKKFDNYAMSGWENLKSGNVAGAIADTTNSIISIFNTFSNAKNERINKEIKESERAVKRLELAYVDLQQSVDKAYGTAVIGAKQAALANKELQLAEIQRQIQLEKSRSSKNRDEDKIIDLQKQYRELFYEIKNGYTEIVDDLMGTDVASFAENLVSSMIDAFKQGEDYMKVFSDKFDEMIDNMIMKSIVSRVVSQYLDAMWEDANKRINDRTEKEREDAAKAHNEAVRRANLSDEEIKRSLSLLRGESPFFGFSTVTQKDIDEYRKAALAEEDAAQARLKAASEFTKSDINDIMQDFAEVMPELGQKLKDAIGEYYKFGESSETQLSSLQQGLQSMSESTANALEAYANSISQQAYYHSSLLEQIRDSVVGLNLDVSLGVQSQLLLQLQNSYQTQQAIQQILEGVLVPSGRAFAVELIS